MATSKSPTTNFEEVESQGLKTSKGIIPEDETERVRQQTHKEWWADYDNATAIKPTTRRELNKHTESQKVTGGLPKQEVTKTARGCRESEAKKEKFIFDCFRTTRLGRLVISFTSLNSGIIADTFFNVDIKKQRGKGEYRTGQGGQFYPKPRSKFRKFWLSIVQKPPLRWSTVHKELRPRLKDYVFTGELKHTERTSGELYTQLIDVRLFGTGKLQNWYKNGTELVQTFGTDKPMKHSIEKVFREI